MNDAVIIGLAGPIAAGKTTIAEALEKRGYRRYSCSDTLKEMMDGLYVDEYPAAKDFVGLPKTRENLLDLGVLLRKEYGDDIVVRLTIRRALEEGTKKIVIDGARGVAEFEAIKKHGGVVVFIDAPMEERYERWRRRQKEMDGTDKSLERFIELNAREERDFHVSKTKELADIILQNTGNLENLERITRIFV